jgi:S-(hydroxymethyl)glutathione dehydrogenase/alcohol dehydrogenase
MKIRAACSSSSAPLVVQEVGLAEPGPGEALVRLVACGVCHTDMYTASFDCGSRRSTEASS